jgi:phage tail sheath protein FI
MAFQLSPGINVSEIDSTTVVPAVATTTGAFAGVFAWGPVNEPILVSSEVDVVKRFGKPVTGFNIETFFTAADFLAYGNSLYITRAAANNAITSFANTSSANLTFSTGNTEIFLTGGLNKIEAKYPGELGNALKVIFVGKTAFATNNAISSYTNRAPTTSNNVHVAVIDTDGKFTGVKDGVLEVFEDLSVSPVEKTEDGANSYLVDAINQRSRYINITANATFTANVTATAALVANLGVTVTLAGGVNGDGESTISVGSLQTAYDKYKSPEDIDVSFIIGGRSSGDVANTTIANYLISIAEFRKDAIAFVSPPKSTVLLTGDLPNSNAQANVVSWASNVTSSSYAVIDSGYMYRYDRYNDKYVYTPLNGSVAGLCVRTDETRDPWFSPAGYNRGSIKNVIKLAYNPNKTDRDQLYKNNVNPVITQAGQGTILFGDKTHLTRPSAFDRINVRRLFIVLEKAISRAAQSTLFEFNDEFTRAQFKNLVEPFLRNVQGRRGIYDFKVVCDETNNTAEIIDRNEFVGDIYIKPARAINFIQLNFVAVRTGVEFDEIVGNR